MMSFKHIYISLLLLSTLCGVFLYVLHERTLVTQEVKTSVVPPPPPTPTPPKATTTPKVVMPAEEWLEKTLKARKDGSLSTRTWDDMTELEIVALLPQCGVSVIIFPSTAQGGYFLAYLRDGTEVISLSSGYLRDRSTKEAPCTPPLLTHQLPFTHDKCMQSDLCI
jgi:hypothetical protein